VPGSSAPLHSFRIDTARVDSSGWRRTMRAASLARLTGVSSRSRNLPTVVGISWSTCATGELSRRSESWPGVRRGRVATPAHRAVPARCGAAAPQVRLQLRGGAHPTAATGGWAADGATATCRGLFEARARAWLLGTCRS
jgi:hypothetical protein